MADPPNVEFIKDSENVERTVQSAEVARKSVLCRHLQLTKTISSVEVLFSISIFVHRYLSRYQYFLSLPGQELLREQWSKTPNEGGAKCVTLLESKLLSTRRSRLFTARTPVLVQRGNTEYGRDRGRDRQIVWIRKCYRFLNKEGSVYPASVLTAGVRLALSVPLTQ